MDGLQLPSPLAITHQSVPEMHKIDRGETIPRSQTFHYRVSGEGRRSEAAVLPPDALQSLHRLHEGFLKRRDPDAAQEDLSDEALDRAWRLGSWQVHGAVPRSSERPLSTRQLRSCPASTNGELLLRNHGVAAVNTKGRKAADDEALGQDNFSVSHLGTGWEVVCLMDGHGRGGHWPATRAARTVPFFLQGQSCATMLRHGQVEAALGHAFAKAQADLVSRSLREQQDLQATGCTALCALWSRRKRRLWVATAGDTRAILIVPGIGAVAQTRDHKPDVESERARIEQMGGQVTVTAYDDGYVDRRVCIRGQDYPGLSMTRSLGDLAVKGCGVVAEPEIVQWPVEHPGAMVLAASDGLWEFLTTDEVARVVLEGLARRALFADILHELVKASHKLWEENEGSYCDDVTVVLASLPPSSTLQHSETWCCAPCSRLVSDCHIS